ncbi:MAG: MipA/OmpV family protein [Halofilum sp. (in: g-proteobacteria)]
MERVIGVLCLALATPATLSANSDPGSSPDTGWSLRVGAGVATSPDYVGSDEQETRGIPIVDARYGDWFFANAGGIGVKFAPTDRLTTGVALRYGGGRSDEGDLSPLAEVDDGVLGNTFLRYRFGVVEWGLRLSQAWSGDNDGERVRLSVASRLPVGQPWQWAVSAKVDWHSEDWNDTLFSLSSTQAARLGVTPFSADGGMGRAGLGTRLSYRLSTDWSLIGRLEVSRLLGDAADSPIVSTLGDRNQSSAAFLAVYRF